MTTETETTCAYCGATVSEADRVPDLLDHAAWKRMTATHAAYCEWMTSRAARLEPLATGAMSQIVEHVRALDVSVGVESLDGDLRMALASVGVETTPQAVDALRDALSPTRRFIVEGAGSDDEWHATDAEDAAGQAARAQWGDGASVEWVGTGPAHADGEFRAEWMETGVQMSKRIVVSRVAS